MMLGLLLARAGIRTTVLEKHRDFLRDFRGDTIHPSTLELLHELAIADEFLSLPHQKVAEIQAQIGDTLVPIADFSRLPVRSPIAMIPQWDFRISSRATPGGTRASSCSCRPKRPGSLFNADKVVGVRAATPGGALEIADLVVGADGRHSSVRSAAGLEVQDLGAPIDVLWFRLSKQPGDPEATMGRFDRGRILVMLNRGDYWQCAFVIGKGSLDAVRGQGLEAFRSRIGLPCPSPASAYSRSQAGTISSFSPCR